MPTSHDTVGNCRRTVDKRAAVAGQARARRQPCSSAANAELRKNTQRLLSWRKQKSPESSLQDSASNAVCGSRRAAAGAAAAAWQGRPGGLGPSLEHKREIRRVFSNRDSNYWANL